MTMRPARAVSNAIALTSILIFFCAGCAQRMQSLKDDKLANGKTPAILQALKISDDASQIEISADKPLVYTFYTLTGPPKAVIDLAQAEPGTVATALDVNSGSIKRIEVGRHGFGESVLTRVEITLAKERPFSVAVDPNNPRNLLIRFEKDVADEKKPDDQVEEKQLKVEDLAPAPVAPVAETEKPAPAATEKTIAPPPAAHEQPGEVAKKEEVKGTSSQKGRVLTAVKNAPDGIEISVAGGVTSFNAFRLTDPLRLILDLPGVKGGIASKAVPIDNFGISQARIGMTPDKTRIVFDAAKKVLPPYQIVKNDNGLKIEFKPGSAAEGPKPVTTGAVVEPGKPAAPTASPVKPQPSSVEAIDFQPMGEYSRIAIRVTGDCTAEKPRKVSSGWALTIKHCQLPRKLQRTIDTGAFASSVREITPYQVKVSEGNDAKLLVKLRAEAPFTFRQEGKTFYWDIKNPPAKESAALPAEASTKAPFAPPAAQKAKPAVNLERDLLEKQQTARQQPEAKVYTGRKVTLEFSDADVRKIFQLIAEVSNLNFLIADDVTGTISLKLVNVPWDQALDVILESKNLEKRQEGNILYIKKKGMFRTAEQEEVTAREDREKRQEPKTKLFDVNFAAIGDVVTQLSQFKSKNPRATIAPDPRTNRIIVTDIEDSLDKMTVLLKQLDIPEKQVMIEARIVEASSSFTRDLGVQWGVHYQDGSASFLGINNLDAGFGGIVNQVPPTSGTSGPGTAIGVSFGKLTSNIQLDLRLAAAATAGQIKIISTPKVVTLNNKAAKISQGQSIPYQTTSAEGTKTEFVQAALSLDVTPHVTADGNIGMKIKASNNSAGAGSPPPINTKEATTELQVLDGETTVIGGIYVDSDTESNSGVPFLMDIPMLGWLFKSNSKTKTKSELLIFITPRIVH